VLIKVKVHPCLDLNFAGSRQKKRPLNSLRRQQSRPVSVHSNSHFPMANIKIQAELQTIHMFHYLAKHNSLATSVAQSAAAAVSSDRAHSVFSQKAKNRRHALKRKFALENF
jgi:hypothetical protein